MIISTWRERTNFLRSRGGTLGDLLDRLATVHGDRRLVEQADPIALAGDRCALSYREAAGVVDGASRAIGAIVPADQTVALRGANGYGLFLAVLAAARAGRVAVPLNPQLSGDEVDYVVRDACATLVDIDDLSVDPASVSVRDAAARATRSRTESPPAGPDDIAGIFYTSGTTGKPKGVSLTHRALLDLASRGVVWPAQLRRDEIVASLPVPHIMGFELLLGAACAGIPLFFLPRFHPVKVLDAIETRRATVFVGVPAMYRMMLDAGAEQRDLRSVRLWAAGADVMPEDLARRFKRLGASVTLPLVGWSLGEASFAEGYGMVEIAGAASAKVSPPMLPFGLGASLGIPLPPYRFRVVDDRGDDVRRGQVGELLVKGPGALSGYHGDAAATGAVLVDGGWVRTGDLARKGPFGIVQFAGRKKDVVKSGGYSVYPPEVEEVLRQHPGVGDAGVIGRTDDALGEVPVAYVELVPGSDVTSDELLAWARVHLAEYKCPVQVVVVAALPRTSTGKVAKTELRDPAAS
jgi:acyl-CoA synthetase (AMP-forming)/AMP-acid ligase II